MLMNFFKIIAIIFGIVYLLLLVYNFLELIWNIISGICEHSKAEELKHIKHRIETSDSSIIKLRQINSRYSFSIPSPDMFYTCHCRTREEFNRVSLPDFFAISAKRNETKFRKYNSEIDQLIPLYNEYEEEFSSVMQKAIDDNEHDEKYKKCVQEILLKTKLSFNPNYTVTVRKEYYSPKQKHYVHAEMTFSRDDVLVYSQRIKQETIEKKQLEKEAAYQRSLMSSSLRYDVLKRDNFRCVLCGASPKTDGIRLHVDHIKPVAKGGKTEIANLRTLCDRCNIGKSDKYDPDGPN